MYPEKKDVSAMKTAKLILNNEDGYVIVVAILILALLTIIGTSSTQIAYRAKVVLLD